MKGVEGESAEEAECLPKPAAVATGMVGCPNQGTRTGDAPSAAVLYGGQGAGGGDRYFAQNGPAKAEQGDHRKHPSPHALTSPKHEAVGDVSTSMSVLPKWIPIHSVGFFQHGKALGGGIRLGAPPPPPSDRIPGTDQAVRGGRHGQKWHSGFPQGQVDARSSTDACLS